MTDKQFIELVGNTAGKEAAEKAKELVSSCMAYKIAIRGIQHKLAVLRGEN
jgi:hypothetical protein